MAQHSAKGSEYHFLTANHLLSGKVVYFSDEGKWVEDIKKAHLAKGQAEAEALLQRAEKTSGEHEVLDIYLFALDKKADGFSPSSIREHIRQLGPSVRKDLGKQAE